MDIDYGHKQDYLLNECCIACLTEKGHLHGENITINCYIEFIDARLHEKAKGISIVFCRYCAEVLEQFRDFKLICNNAMHTLEKRLQEVNNHGPMSVAPYVPKIVMKKAEVDVLNVEPRQMNKKRKLKEFEDEEENGISSDDIQHHPPEPVFVKNEMNEEMEEGYEDEGIDYNLTSDDEEYIPGKNENKKGKTERKTRNKTKAKRGRPEKTKKVTGIKKLMDRAMDRIYTSKRQDEEESAEEHKDDDVGWWDQYWENGDKTVKTEKNVDSKSKDNKKKKRKTKANDDEDDEEEIAQETNVPIWCNFCNTTYPSIHSEPNNYTSHINSVHAALDADGKIECTICKAKSRTRDTFRRHFQNHRVFEKPKKCPRPGCPETFTSAHEYKLHKRRHNIKAAQCPHCDFTCKSKDFIKSHILVKHMNGVWCKYCRHGIAWDKWEEHEKMEIEKKQKTPKIPFMCEICGLELSSRASKNVHMRSKHSDNECTCELCGSTFQSMMHLRRHVLYNHEEKKYECDICGRKIRQKSHLRKHMEYNHTADRYTTCDVCGKTVYKRGLQYHIKTIHAEHKQFECPFCKRRFGVEDSMKQHVVKKHGNEKPLPCPLCPRGYFTMQEYRKHLQNAHDQIPGQGELLSDSRIIKNEDGVFDLGNITDMSCMFGDFSCKICLKKYNILYSLRDHLHQHPECMPFRCTLCDKVYFLERQLAKHYEKSHQRKYEFTVEGLNTSKSIKATSIAEKVLEFTIVNGDIETCTRKERVPRKNYPARGSKPKDPTHVPKPNPTRMKNIKMERATAAAATTSYQQHAVQEEVTEEIIIDPIRYMQQATVVYQQSMGHY